MDTKVLHLRTDRLRASYNTPPASRRGIKTIDDYRVAESLVLHPTSLGGTFELRLMKSVQKYSGDMQRTPIEW